jgi:hypothetical protein
MVSLYFSKEAALELNSMVLEQLLGNNDRNHVLDLVEMEVGCRNRNCVEIECTGRAIGIETLIIIELCPPKM